MANNFKSDDSFLRKLAVGAADTKATIEKVRGFGFQPIELERGSTGFKIWKKIKIKRVRVPDIMCLKTGIRFESRGKTKLEISMSHSLNNDKRRWDYGMRNDDFIAIMLLNQNKNNPTLNDLISPIHFIEVKDMRKVYDDKQVELSKPKGFEEGSEVRAIWNSKFAKVDSKVIEITNNRMCLESDEGKKQYIHLEAKKGRYKLYPQVKYSEVVCKNQIVASVVPIKLEIKCPPTVSENYFIEKLNSKNLTERYAAAKALRYRGYSQAFNQLKALLHDKEEDIYVQLEAAAALASKDEPNAWTFLDNKLGKSSEEIPLETQLETIIVLSELESVKSESLIIRILMDKSCDEELRAGAAWALGQFVTKKSIFALTSIFDNTSKEIKTEAARALLRIAKPQLEYVLSLFQSCEVAQRDGIAWVLAQIGNFDINNILSNDINIKKWISYIVGYGKKNFCEASIQELCNKDKDVYFAASVLWQILSSWVYELKEY